MLCDDCTKKIVCKFKEDCNIYERNLDSGSHIGRIFGSKPYCEEKETKPTYNTFSQTTYPQGVRGLAPFQIEPQIGFIDTDESIGIITTTNNTNGEYSLREDVMPMTKNIQIYNLNEIIDKLKHKGK